MEELILLIVAIVLGLIFKSSTDICNGLNPNFRPSKIWAITAVTSSLLLIVVVVTITLIGIGVLQF